MKGFKGFNSKLQCTPNGNVFQYEIGKTYTEPTAIPCHKGFHFVESPLDTLSYYGLTDGARYCEVDAEGVSVQTKDDTKRACTSITIGAEIKIPAIVKAAVKFVSDRITSTTGDSAHSATTGDYAHSATTGDSAHSATTGNSAEASVAGKNAIASSLGYRGKAKGALGCFIVLAEYDSNGDIAAVGADQVDGKKIKANTFYVLKGAKFTEAK